MAKLCGQYVLREPAGQELVQLQKIQFPPAKEPASPVLR